MCLSVKIWRNLPNKVRLSQSTRSSFFLFCFKIKQKIIIRNKKKYDEAQILTHQWLRCVLDLIFSLFTRVLIVVKQLEEAKKNPHYKFRVINLKKNYSFKLLWYNLAKKLNRIIQY